MNGLGEPLLHPRVVDFVRISAQAGLRPLLVTNGSLLTRRMSEDLVQAGLRGVNVSIGGFTREAYSRVHRGLESEAVLQNPMDFLEVSGGAASLDILIPPTEDSVREAERIAAFWRARGARFCFIFPVALSRGGALSAPEAEAFRCQTARLTRIPRGCINIEEVFRPTRRDRRIMHGRGSFVCYPKDRFTFISWQGNYHLCSSDYEKKHPLGSVFDTSMDEAYCRKAAVGPANNPLCGHCNMKGDLAPRDGRFYLKVAAYWLKSRLAASGVGGCLSDRLLDAGS
jgi:molybdenum cofactor biosynthesis enzyme MoaA